MTQREKLKEFLKMKFPNGLSPLPSGYCQYIFYEKGEFSSEHFTSGGLQGRPIPPKYYETPEEIYEDLKMYYDPKN